MVIGKFFCKFVATRCSVQTRDECKERVDKVPGGVFKHYKTWAGALDRYTAAYDQSRIRVLPFENGPFDKPVHPSEIYG